MNHNLFRPIVNVVHSLYPCHLILFLQFVRYIIRFLYLPDNELQSALYLLIRIYKIHPKPTCQNQIIEHHWIIFFQILPVHSAIFSSRTLFIRKLQYRNIIISNQLTQYHFLQFCLSILSFIFYAMSSLSSIFKK